MIDIIEKVLLIRISKSYPNHESNIDLYNWTRGTWKIGERRELADYAFAVFEGEIKEVYRIQKWEPATVELYMQNGGLREDWHTFTGRWQFVGEIDEKMSKKYKGLNIQEYFKKGNANPIMYLNI